MNKPTLSEFYNKYVKIKLSNGDLVSPRKLTEYESKVYDKADELKISPYIIFRGRKQSSRIIVNPIITKIIGEE